MIRMFIMRIRGLEALHFLPTKFFRQDKKDQQDKNRTASPSCLDKSAEPTHLLLILSKK